MNYILPFLIIVLAGCTEKVKNHENEVHNKFVSESVEDLGLSSRYLRLKLPDNRVLIIQNHELYELYGRPNKMSYDQYRKHIASILKNNEELLLTNSQANIVKHSICNRDSIESTTLETKRLIRSNFKIIEGKVIQYKPLSSKNAMQIIYYCLGNYLPTYKEDLTGWLIIEPDNKLLSFMKE